MERGIVRLELKKLISMAMCQYVLRASHFRSLIRLELSHTRRSTLCRFLTFNGPLTGTVNYGTCFYKAAVNIHISAFLAIPYHSISTNKSMNFLSSLSRNSPFRWLPCSRKTNYCIIVVYTFRKRHIHSHHRLAQAHPHPASQHLEAKPQQGQRKCFRLTHVVRSHHFDWVLDNLDISSRLRSRKWSQGSAELFITAACRRGYSRRSVPTSHE